MLKKLLSSKFIIDNLYLLTGALILNIFAFLFHFYMGRKLGPEDYGILAALISLIGLLAISCTTIQLSLSKFVATFNTHKEFGKLKYIYKDSLKKFNKLFFTIFLLLLPFNIFLSNFLKIKYSLLFIVSLTILVLPLISVTGGFLQGMQNFKSLGIGLSLEGIVRFFLSVFLVALGLSVFGALIGVFFSLLIVGVYYFTKMGLFMKEDAETFSTKSVYLFILPVLLTLMIFTSFYSFDLLLIKHFFSDLEAGYFSAINLIGKIVFFASFSVVQVMFPKVAEFYEAKKNHRNLLFKSFLLMLAIILPILLIYFFFGDFVVSLLYGENYLSIAGLIGLYGIFIAFVSFSQLIGLYFLSLRRLFFTWILLIFLILEMLLIWLYHESLLQIIIMLIFLGVILFLVFGAILIFGGKDE